MPCLPSRLCRLTILTMLLTATPVAWSQESDSLLGWGPARHPTPAQPAHAGGGLTNFLASFTAGSPQAEATAASPRVNHSPRAILVRNPNARQGQSPYALADDQGRIQRLVEPTTGVELEPYVGRIVRVNHDTGATLLATQLDLPQGTLAAPPAPFVSPVQFAVAQAPTGEPLPEPIVLEEVVGQPEGPALNGLQFPSSLQAGPPPAVAAPAHAPAACVGCGAAVSGPFGHTACGPHCPLAGMRWSLPSGGLDFSVDALWLRTHDSAAANSGEDFDFATRWELGYRPGWGRRIALRYFEYDTGLTNGPFDVELIDIETQRWFPLNNCGAQIGIGGGVRWAEYDEAGALTYSDTVGPVLGLYARAPAIGRTEGIFTLRQSYQFGDAGIRGRGTFGITELQIGLEQRRCMLGGEGFVRGFFESQYWDDVGQAVDDSTSRGLVGFGFGLGLRR